MRRLSHCLQRQWPSLMFAIILGGLMLDMLWRPSGPGDLLVLRRHGDTLARQRDLLLLDNAAVRERISKLQSDNAYLQRLIRQQLGYVRPGEVVYRFADSTPSP
jgi:cell division protein FtsB